MVNPSSAQRRKLNSLRFMKYPSPRAVSTSGSGKLAIYVLNMFSWVGDKEVTGAGRNLQSKWSRNDRTWEWRIMNLIKHSTSIEQPVTSTPEIFGQVRLQMSLMLRCWFLLETGLMIKPSWSTAIKIKLKLSSQGILLRNRQSKDFGGAEVVDFAIVVIQHSRVIVVTTENTAFTDGVMAFWNANSCDPSQNTYGASVRSSLRGYLQLRRIALRRFAWVDCSGVLGRLIWVPEKASNSLSRVLLLIRS